MTQARVRYDGTFISGKPDAHRTLVNRRRSTLRMSADQAATVAELPFENTFGGILVCMCVCNKATVSSSTTIPSNTSSNNLLQVPGQVCPYDARLKKSRL